jgi:hypothetical protein
MQQANGLALFNAQAAYCQEIDNKNSPENAVARAIAVYVAHMQPPLPKLTDYYAGVLASMLIQYLDRQFRGIDTAKMAQDIIEIFREAETIKEVNTGVKPED